MILVLKKDATPRQEARLLAYLEQLGLAVTREACEGSAVWLLSGGTARVDGGRGAWLRMGGGVRRAGGPGALAGAPAQGTAGNGAAGGGRDHERRRPPPV